MKRNIKSLLVLAPCLVAGFSISSAQEHGHDWDAPNGGRIVKEIEPHAEIFVTEEGEVKITFLNDHGEVVSPGKQLVSLVGGNRMNPIELSFAEAGESLVSEGKLPVDKAIPVVVQFQSSPTSEVFRERFQLNMSSCPSCEYKEYACACHEEKENEHGHSHGGHGHDH